MQEKLKGMIREVPDFPKPGILFYDLSTLLKNKTGLRSVIDLVSQEYGGRSIHKVIGIESRGFIFAPSVAYNLEAGLILVRKQGKLPSDTVQASYELEYGQDTLEMHRDAVEPGERILIVDDLIATGGTAVATAQMVAEQGGEVVALAFIVELQALNGRSRLGGFDVFSVLKY